jgi:hypothetical protein
MLAITTPSISNGRQAVATDPYAKTGELQRPMAGTPRRLKGIHSGETERPEQSNLIRRGGGGRSRQHQMSATTTFQYWNWTESKGVFLSCFVQRIHITIIPTSYIMRYNQQLQLWSIKRNTPADCPDIFIMPNFNATVMHSHTAFLGSIQKP